MATETQSMPFIKHLASSDRKIRTSALDTLRTFLAASASTSRLTRTDNLKLWKGLFYSLWMCDRPVPQQNLCADLAGLLDTISSSAARSSNNNNNGVVVAGEKEDDDDDGQDGQGEVQVVIGWLAAFWETMAREWTSIDVLRLEKFLLLVRRVFGASLAWANAASSSSSSSSQKRKTKKSSTLSSSSSSKKKSKNSKARQEMEEDDDDEISISTTRIRQDALLQLFRTWPFDESGDLARVPVGLRLHVLDIWVDEAEKAGGIIPAPAEAAKDAEREEEEQAADNKSSPGKSTYFLDQLREIVEAQYKSPSKPVRARAKESLADERLPWNEGNDGEEGGDGDVDMNGGGGDDDGDDGWSGFDD